MKRTKLSILILFASILSWQACTCFNCGNGNVTLDLPDSIFTKVDKYIESKVGKDFFANYFSADFLNSKKKKDFYEVRYDFIMIQYEFVNEKIVVITDLNGNIPEDYLPSGIPTCVRELKGCDFVVDEKLAVQIAETEKFPSGVKDWMVEFRWSSELNKYIWHIISTTYQTGTDENYKARGEELMIDPVSSNILKRREWAIK